MILTQRELEIARSGLLRGAAYLREQIMVHPNSEYTADWKYMLREYSRLLARMEAIGILHKNDAEIRREGRPDPR